MEGVETVKALLGQSAVLLTMGAGLLLMFGSVRWMKRLFMLALLAVVVATVMTPEWLP